MKKEKTPIEKLHFLLDRFDDCRTFYFGSSLSMFRDNQLYHLINKKINEGGSELSWHKPTHSRELETLLNLFEVIEDIHVDFKEKKEINFTFQEKTILQSLTEEWVSISRDYGNLYIYTKDGMYDEDYDITDLDQTDMMYFGIYNHLFESVKEGENAITFRDYL